MDDSSEIEPSQIDFSEIGLPVSLITDDEIEMRLDLLLLLRYLDSGPNL